jgi:methylthioribulose-1-phosphate dehydratase
MSVDMQQYRHCVQALVQVGSDLYHRGWSPATSSNYSLRVDAQHCAITVSGKHKGALSADDIMLVDLDGRPCMDKKPSAETALHVWLYRRYPEVNAVLHTHSQTATVLTRLFGGDRICLEGYELQKAFEGVTSHQSELTLPVFENTQDIVELAAEVDAWLAAHPNPWAYLIRGHGMYAWGAGLDDCLRHLEALEYLLACELDVLRIKGLDA